MSPPVFLVDLHTHTSYGSSCAYMTPSQSVRRAKQMGLDGICITEHNQLWDEGAIERLSRNNDFLVIGGVEISTDWGDILVFGLHEPVREVSELEALRGLVKAAGGVMIGAHPFRGEFGMLTDPPTLEDAAARPVFQYLDGLEVCNGQSGPQEKSFASQVASHLHLSPTGGSDAHAILGLGRCFTIFDREITCERQLVEEIREGRCRASGWDARLLKR